MKLQSKMPLLTRHYLKHYDTGKDCKRCEHHVIYRGNNGSVECVKGLKHKSYVVRELIIGQKITTV